MAIASSLLIPIAGGYTLLVFILPIVVVLADKDFVFSQMNITYCCFIGIVLMPKQIDLRLQTFEPYALTLGGVLNPSLALCVVAFITAKHICSMRKNTYSHSRNLETLNTEVI